ncbi:MAG: type VI secretion system baseplate subunit TssE, partial [Vibrio sp.]|nr:type VI secretion system baseplate subunit TssE [Vibrio sp.]
MTYIAPEESAFGVGFFERLEAGTKPMSLTQGPNAWDVLQSIKRNVSNILNTRMGEAQSAPT